MLTRNKHGRICVDGRRLRPLHAPGRKRESEGRAGPGGPGGHFTVYILRVQSSVKRRWKTVLYVPGCGCTTEGAEMKEYIEKAAVLNLLEKINPVDYGSMFDYQAHSAVSECLREARYGIESIPAADVAEVQHGRWVGIEYDGYADGCPVYDLWECSECGEEVRGEDVPDTHPWCHACGARMDKEDEHEAD